MDINIKNINKFISIVFDPLFLRALLKGSAAGVEHLPLLNTLKVDYVLDIGANRGQFALAARKSFPEAIIHSVEPLDDPSRIFMSVFEGDNKVIFHNCAIGSRREITLMHISSQDDSSSLLEIGEAQIKLFPETFEKGTREVEVFPLWDLIDISNIPTSSLLKIDVQGYELEVLKGCQKALHKFSYIYVECSFIELYKDQALAHQIIDYLSSNKFILNGVYNVFYDGTGKAIQSDLFFMNNRSIS